MVSTDKVANITSVYGAYLKNLKSIARKSFQLKPIHGYSPIPIFEKNPIFQKNRLEMEDFLTYVVIWIFPIIVVNTVKIMHH